jgi:hypothetical protein
MRAIRPAVRNIPALRVEPLERIEKARAERKGRERRKRQKRRQSAGTKAWGRPLKAGERAGGTIHAFSLSQR